MPAKHTWNACESCGSLGPHVKCATCGGDTCHCELIHTERGSLCPWCATIVTNWKLLSPLVKEALKAATCVRALP
ncbi:unnamed protein product [marine sediment metagenome]|uniref:Uncharacterized protein n=1 Tax=marine sediment metagenome TaxID=412755 RepID=X0YVK8_9ZZZZ